MSTYSNMRLCLQVVYIANFQRLCHPRSAVWHILIRLYLNMGYHTKTQFHARFSRKNYDKALIFGIPYCSDEPAYILMLSSKQIHNRKHVEKLQRKISELQNNRPTNVHHSTECSDDNTNIPRGFWLPGEGTHQPHVTGGKSRTWSLDCKKWHYILSFSSNCLQLPLFWRKEWKQRSVYVKI